MTDEVTSSNPLDLATELTIAWLGNPNTRISADEVPSFLRKMHETVSSLGGSTEDQKEPEATPSEHVAAVSVRKSLASKDHIISMIDGKPYKTLRRHLATNGLTPAEYRDRYGLKADYPMVAESYSESRRAMAKKIGLGRKALREQAPQQDEAAGATEASDAPAAPRRGRRKAQAAERAE